MICMYPYIGTSVSILPPMVRPDQSKALCHALYNNPIP
uniref:Uncharacterized protein n=1 Tax=Picea sitchensis TaxID=3332 RepID=D5AB42_PICSI|nr:unknown [Picea sitchensis]